MGLFLRKAITFGPIRFNLSKSGIGVSAGIKGLRIGKKPSGRSYVYMGRHGLYYRKTLGGGAALRRKSPARAEPTLAPAGEPTPVPAIEEQGLIATADAASLTDSSASGLLKELQQAHSRVRFAPILLCGLSVAALVCLLLHWFWLAGTAFVGGLVGFFLLRPVDQRRKTVTLDYDLDADAQAAFSALIQAFNILVPCDRIWRIRSQRATDDWKHHAGANALITRRSTKVGSGTPPCVKTNVTTIALPIEEQTLYFMPDRILVYQGRKVGAVKYGDFEAESRRTEFMEEHGVPTDASVVRSTWRYVNKSGGPDRRFKDNYEIPVCEYAEVTLRRQTGMNILLQMSDLQAGGAFADSLKKSVARITSVAKEVKPPAPKEEPVVKDEGTYVPAESALHVRCPKCHRAYKVSASALGKKAKCKCGTVFSVQTDA